jgi:hypothetical protein
MTACRHAVRVLPGPPRSRVLPEISRRCTKGPELAGICATRTCLEPPCLTKPKNVSRVISTLRACSLVSSLLLNGTTMSQQSSLTQSAHSVRQVLTAYSGRRECRDRLDQAVPQLARFHGRTVQAAAGCTTSCRARSIHSAISASTNDITLTTDKSVRSSSAGGPVRRRPHDLRASTYPSRDD